MAKKKIAIIGGGVASVTAAMRLTDDPNWRDTFESITIYQMGWRLGGKGATGRTHTRNRILEHGLHFWLGFYENAFQLIQKVYEVAARPNSSPIPTWRDAFKGQNDVGVMDFDDGVWSPWLFHLPVNAGVPGSGSLDSLSALVEAIAHWLGLQWLELARPLPDEVASAQPGHDMMRIGPQLRAGRYSEDAKLAIANFKNASAQLRASGPSINFDRRTLLVIEMGATMLTALVHSGVFSYDDLVKIEDLDFAEWLATVHPDPAITSLEQNPLLRGLYDFAFAFRNGDPTQPNFSAAPAVRTILRMLLTYKGSIFYKMVAGMGDSIFAPAYEALVKRGVEVKFFHKAKSLKLSLDKSHIESIVIGLQATPKGHYQPFKHVHVDPSRDPLPCWPDRPLYHQLVEGDALHASGADLESFWTTWSDVGELTLEFGVDFDEVIFGASLGSVPYLCDELVAASPKWSDMVNHLTTVRTQAAQLWLNPTIQQLGWTLASPVVDAWEEPFDTWGDMTDIMSFETWGANKPGSLAYFCGPMPGDIPPRTDAGAPGQALAAADSALDDMLTMKIQSLWPALGSGGLGAAQVRSRYVRANINPSDRYVQSLAGSAKFRLAANESGFNNLVLTGDWIRNGYNAGCVEAAVWSGIQAANTILGRPLNDGVVSS